MNGKIVLRGVNNGSSVLSNFMNFLAFLETPFFFLQCIELIIYLKYPLMNPSIVAEPDRRCAIPFDKLICVSKKFGFVILSTLEKRLSDCNV